MSTTLTHFIGLMALVALRAEYSSCSKAPNISSCASSRIYEFQGASDLDRRKEMGLFVSQRPPLCTPCSGLDEPSSLRRMFVASLIVKAEQHHGGRSSNVVARCCGEVSVKLGVKE